ncbi:tRNA (adenosine(37)-N6)-threonylcarbamoyltransferase complex dimerization subunit type 1 TsaB [Leptolyngbya sp. ST-U4]|uniref:tRNA (adenosine(37)-N6)-threonylcarbamoyltransferase complex dimerization subunit type 1 TsaB n=1 Tax=Leptolyngbya sp. ST-U4 TaxID=2933912 RepID=UPI00199F2E24|nr:tRNA (adenosine(37)-N6)-threonylcarbamoyltransferase complex dimerization subunit type 1 TsaB [Cyanobacteria bacterium FACHB-502]
MPATFTTHSNPTYALALHTASSDFGLAIDNFQGDYPKEGTASHRRSQTWDLGRDLSTHLHVYLQEFLLPQTWRDLMFLAVAKGPGGFTGTRIGVVTARTLAQQLNLPLFPISTLAAAAWANRPSLTDESSQPIDLAIEMPAQRGEVHTAIYTVSSAASGLQPTLQDCVQAIDSWQNFLDRWERPYKLIKLEDGLGATAPALLELAYQEWQKEERPHWVEAVPFYGQSPVRESER